MTALRPRRAALLPLLLVATAHAAEPVAIPAGPTRASDGASTTQGSVAAFRMDETEVSVDAFEAFAAAGYQHQAWWTPAGWTWAQAHPGGAGPLARRAGRAGNHPVVNVTAYEAEAYCASVGGQLPGELQWQRAACGDDGRRFPWGADEDYEARWYGDGKWGGLDAVKTAAVTDAPTRLRSAFGLLHMAGNVWEWTADSMGQWRVLRGGSFMNLPSYCTCGHREPARPDEGRLTVGFRCSYSP